MASAEIRLQLNEFVRETLSPYLAGNYCLNEEGQRRVIDANAKLDETYAKANDLPVADWCFNDMIEKLNRVPPRERELLLDVCAGTGFVALNMMKHGAFKRCVALDINPAALAILNERARELNVSGIETQVGDIFKTNFANNTFDCVMGNAFLHHLPDTKTFINEMFRILKPGGVLCFTCEPSPSAMKWENLIPRFLKGLFGRRHWPVGEVPLTDIWQFQSVALRSGLESAGYKAIKIVGFGRLSTSFATVIDRLWVRLAGYASPSWVRRLAYSLRSFDWGPNSEMKPDEWAAISISARKP